MRLVVLQVSLLLLLFSSCEVAPKKIQYGLDACSYCKMTIVDSRYAAQLVNTKGKAYSFDAIECMLHHLHEQGSNEIGLRLVTDFNRPGELVDALSAHYLICEEMPSPMGANLTSFEKKTELEDVFAEKGGEVLSWDKLYNRFHGEEH